MPALPTGTVTFLFTDIEGSTRLLQQLGEDAYANVLADHRQLLRTACITRSGQELETPGDGFLFAFPRAKDATLAAVDGQRAILNHGCLKAGPSGSAWVYTRANHVPERRGTWAWIFTGPPGLRIRAH